MHATATCLAVTGLVAVVAPVVRGDVTVYSDRESWEAAVGDFTTVDFTGWPDVTLVTDQYADVGVIFTDGNDFIGCCDTDVYPNDGAGLSGSLFDGFEMVFDQPLRWLAVEWSEAQFTFYDGEQVVYQSPTFGAPFLGFVSSEPFDRAELNNPSGFGARMDDLHFGAPGPGGLWVLAAGMLLRSGRRRCQGSVVTQGRRIGCVNHLTRSNR